MVQMPGKGDIYIYNGLTGLGDVGEAIVEVAMARIATGTLVNCMLNMDVGDHLGV